MYDSSITASSLQVSGLSWADSPVSIDDLAFMELILCLEDSDKAIMDKMREIRALQDRKSEISEEMSEINTQLKESEAEDGDDWVVTESQDEAIHDESLPRKYLDMFGLLDKESLPGMESTLWDKLSDEDIRELADEGVSQAKEEAAARGMYTKEDLESRLDELQREFEELNKSSDLMLIDLNRLMNKRNQAVQLTTNIMQSCHQTAMGVIANFK